MPEDELKAHVAELKEILKYTVSYDQLRRIQELLNLLEGTVAETNVPKTLARARNCVQELEERFKRDTETVSSFLELQLAKSPLYVADVLRDADDKVTDALQCLFNVNFNLNDTPTDHSLLCALYLLLEYGSYAQDRWKTFDLEQLCLVSKDGTDAAKFLWYALKCTEREDKHEVVSAFIRGVYIMEHGSETAADSHGARASFITEVLDDSRAVYDELHALMQKLEVVAHAADRVEADTRNSQLVRTNPVIKTALLEKAFALAYAEYLAEFFELTDTKTAYLNYVANLVVRISGDAGLSAVASSNQRK